MATPRLGLLLYEKQDWIERRLSQIRICDPPCATTWPRDIRELLQVIRENIFDPLLNVGFARGRCRLRNNNISTRFHRLVGKGIREYIEEQRMIAAAQLLHNEEIDIFLVAVAVGYEYQETFCRAFRRQFGCTPSTYRRRIQRSRITR